MKTLLLTLLLFPIIATAQKSNFVSAGIVGTTSATIIYGAKVYQDRPPIRSRFVDSKSYVIAQRQHLKTTRAMYAVGGITATVAVIQATVGTVKIIKRKNALLELNANSVYLTVNF